MLKNSSIILIAIICLLIIYLMLDNRSTSTSQLEKFSGIRAQPIYKYKYRNRNEESEMNQLVDDVVSWNGEKESDVVKEKLNHNLLDIQWHNDYRDVQDGIQNLVADRRQRFNLANIPLIYSEPETDEVKVLVNDFIYVLNDNIRSRVPRERNPNSGWDEAVPDPNIKSGWEKSQESLGLPTSLYQNPAPKSIVRLISIEYVQKYETDDEIKYSVVMVLQKENVDDQMVVQASFVQDKRPLTDENNFFITTKVDMKIIIEDVYIKGFLSNDGPDAGILAAADKEKFYDFDTMEINNMTDPKEIQRILMEKYRIKSQEMEQRNAMLDEEGREFHRTLPSLYDFSNVKGTRTIFDDFNTKKVFY
ncbi:hypothetical protein Indivirus_1_48 [Indivirus ILV1]|uniref:Uncharacterized protein n=1 Tax=Indivirus ILV1 TaxID=1977633 RepID=A0A1V0SCJ2_9VIRU|nr:hypothetical protein Indivirus_1_48 [Indivirus ILV1]